MGNKKNMAVAVKADKQLSFEDYELVAEQNKELYKEEEKQRMKDMIIQSIVMIGILVAVALTWSWIAEQQFLEEEKKYSVDNSFSTMLRLCRGYKELTGNQLDILTRSAVTFNRKNCDSKLNKYCHIMQRYTPYYHASGKVFLGEDCDNLLRELGRRNPYES